MTETILGRCIKCKYAADVPVSLKTRVFICPDCGHEGTLSYSNIFVVWLKTFLVNGFWGIVFIGAAVGGVYFFPRVIGHYNGEGPATELQVDAPSKGGQE